MDRNATRAPRHPALRGVVELLWVSAGGSTTASERVVPSGTVHLAWRDVPIRIGAQTEHRGVIGGIRQTAHVHDTPQHYRSVGAVLAPGATQRLFGHPAGAFADRHVGLDALWPDAASLSDRLHGPDPLDVLEAALVAHLRPVPRPPGLNHALAGLSEGLPVQAVARQLHRSPRTVRGWFHDAVGCSPATWVRLQRLQRAFRVAAREPDWSVVAHRAGYFDQAHLCRELRRITGVTPTEWRARSTSANHIPIADLSKPDRPPSA